ncbi:serine hydrolase [Rhodococcus opacus]|uniref:serine hydrolase n=1 Tax=Rhodococcus opacus TaxID=37919 RepID=UPI0015FE0FB7
MRRADSRSPPIRRVAIDSPHRVASFAKLMTAIVTLQLVDEGVLSLDDEASKYVNPIMQVVERDAAASTSTSGHRATPSDADPLALKNTTAGSR